MVLANIEKLIGKFAIKLFNELVCSFRLIQMNICYVLNYLQLSLLKLVYQQVALKYMIFMIIKINVEVVLI